MLKLEVIRLHLICKPFQSSAFGVFHHLDSYEKLVILCNLGDFRNYPKHILWLFYYCQIQYRITRMFSAKNTGHYKHLVSLSKYGLISIRSWDIIFLDT
ncbi:hypothetical protein AMTRI_Chr12g271000 [Amborella trichopoda]